MCSKVVNILYIILISGKYCRNTLTAGLRFSRWMLVVSLHNFHRPGSGHDLACFLLMRLQLWLSFYHIIIPSPDCSMWYGTSPRHQLLKRDWCQFSILISVTESQSFHYWCQIMGVVVTNFLISVFLWARNVLNK